MCTLFVLEDDMVQQYIVKCNLAQFRTFNNVIYYNNGKPLVEYLHANKTDPSRLPDMLFVDLEMPGVNGWDVLDELQAMYHSLCKKVTVYITTASISLKDKLRAANYCFVREFISKPINKQTYIAISHQAENIGCEDQFLKAG